MISDGNGPHRRREGPRGRGGKPGRRTPPPEDTGQEARWMFRYRDRQTPMVVEMRDGEIVRGTIEYYDVDVVKIVPPSGPGRLLRKEEVRLMHPDPDA